MGCGIYKIENLINGKVYIGKSKNIQERWGEHKRQSLCPDSQWNNNYRGCQTPIHKAIRKYGVNNFSFEIIECLPLDGDLNEREK